MLGHLGINVADLAGAKRYYDALVDLLDYEPFLADADQFAYRPANGKRGTYLFFYPAPDTAPYDAGRAGLQHLAFIVASRGRVRAVHERVMAMGSPVLHEPQSFAAYPPPYFATFWRDPDGIMLEAVCHHDRD